MSTENTQEQASSNHPDIEKRVRREIADHLGISEDDTKLESHIVNDLGADSLDAIELVMVIEDEFGLEIADDDAEKCGTVQDVINLVTRLLPDHRRAQTTV